MPPEERERVRKTYFPIDSEKPLALDFDRVFPARRRIAFLGTPDRAATARSSGREGRGVIAVIADIDERKKVEQALRHSKQQYDSMALQIPIGIYILRNSPTCLPPITSARVR